MGVLLVEGSETGAENGVGHGSFVSGTEQRGWTSSWKRWVRNDLTGAQMVDDTEQENYPSLYQGGANEMERQQNF